MLLSACAPQAKLALPPKAPLPTPSPPVAAPAPQPLPAPPPADASAYRTLVASEIWLRNAEVYADPVPEMLKSIVVLEITIDRAGNPIDVSVYRSNGYKHLELRALESVVRASPFPLPGEGVLDGPGSVTFLETFLFRADDRFQLHSLVKTAAFAAARR